MVMISPAAISRPRTVSVWVLESIRKSPAPETQGLAFEAPPLHSIYTRSLTFVKAWETANLDGLASLCTPTVALGVPLYAKEETGLEKLLA